MVQESNSLSFIRQSTSSPEFDIRYKLKDLFSFLKIEQILLVKMIQIFEELGFVTIENGVMKVNKEAAKRDIAESQIYQNSNKLLKNQEMMALGTVQEIYDFLMENRRKEAEENNLSFFNHSY